MRLRSHEFLDSLAISHEAVTFPVDTEKGAASVARALGERVTPRQVVKSLMFETSAKELVLVLVGGDQNVVSGQLKRVLGDRNIRMAPPERVRETSGYEIGSIPPFGWQPPGFRTFIEASLLEEPRLAVGSGSWGHEILLSPGDLVRAASANPAPLVAGDASSKPQPAPATAPATAPAAPAAPAKSPDADEVGLHLADATDVQDLGRHVGQRRAVRGWLYNKRSSGGVVFLQLRDGSGFVQGLVERSSVSEACWDAAQRITRESSCVARGMVREDARAPTGIELTVDELAIVTPCEEFPIGQKEHGPEFLFNNRHLHVRSRQPWAILRIRDEIFYRLTEFFRNDGYARVDTPVLQPTHCEDSTQLFKVDYFGDPMYLSQSGQLYLETLLHGLGKVYDFGPVFRAEQSKTRKHLCEFWMLDWETPFADQTDAEDFLERMIKYLVGSVLDHRREELKILERDRAALERVRDTPFVRIELADAIALLNREHGMSLGKDEDLSAEAEEKLADHFGLPVFVKNFPYAVKAFYMKHFTAPDGVERAICADLVAPDGGGEIGTCAVRENDYQNLLRNLAERGQSPDEYSWYLDVRRYGGVPHAGGGIGPERIIRWLTGVHHIRETIPFPRTLVRRLP